MVGTACGPSWENLEKLHGLILKIRKRARGNYKRTPNGGYTGEERPEGGREHPGVGAGWTLKKIVGVH